MAQVQVKPSLPSRGRGLLLLSLGQVIHQARSLPLAQVRVIDILQPQAAMQELARWTGAPQEVEQGLVSKIYWWDRRAGIMNYPANWRDLNPHRLIV